LGNEDGKQQWLAGVIAWLPRSVPKAYFNFIKAAPVNVRSKAARFEQPIIAVKNVKQPKKGTSIEDSKVQGKKAVKDDEPVLERKDCKVQGKKAVKDDEPVFREERLCDLSCIIPVNRWN
jgi:hypothetical protein